MAHRELGYAIINRLIQDIGENGIVEFMPRMEGTTLHAILAPGKKEQQQQPKKPAAPRPQASEGAPQTQPQTQTVQ
jgi:translation initiation factor IF-3